MSKDKQYVYGTNPYGERIDMYLQDGLAYNTDGSRVGAGTTVQTPGGIYKLGEGMEKGFKVDSHNRPVHGINRPGGQDQLNAMRERYTWSPNKDYSSLGDAWAQSNYEGQRDAIQRRLDTQVTALEGQRAGINTSYDNIVSDQGEVNERNKAQYGQNMLSRGMGRSSIATTGMASMDDSYSKQVAKINMDRGNALNSLSDRIANLKTGAASEIDTLERDVSRQAEMRAWQLEDRDRGQWAQEMGMQQGIDQMSWNAQMQAWDNEFAMNKEERDYYMGLDRQAASMRPGTPEYKAEMAFRDLQGGRSMSAHDLQVQLQNRQITEGTPEYEYFMKMRELEREDMEYQQQLQKDMYDYQKSSYGGGGGGGGGYSRSYSPSSYSGGYNRTPGGGSSGGAGGGTDAELAKLKGYMNNFRVTGDPNTDAIMQQNFYDFRRDFIRDPDGPYANMNAKEREQADAMLQVAHSNLTGKQVDRNSAANRVYNLNNTKPANNKSNKTTNKNTSNSGSKAYENALKKRVKSLGLPYNSNVYNVKR